VGPSSSDLLPLTPDRSGDQAHPYVPGPALASGRVAGSDEPETPVVAAAPVSSGTPGKRNSGANPSKPKTSTRKLKPKQRPPVLDLDAVANVEGLTQEVRLLRAAIRRLAESGDAAGDVKVLAELRHQVETLCRALKTQQSLDGHAGDALASELAQVLDELGDGLGVPQ
jgi:hypothetical protein